MDKTKITAPAFLAVSLCAASTDADSLIDTGAHDGEGFVALNARQVGALYETPRVAGAGLHAPAPEAASLGAEIGADRLLDADGDAAFFTDRHNIGSTDWAYEASEGLEALFALGNVIRFSYETVYATEKRRTGGSFPAAATAGVRAMPSPPTAGLMLLLSVAALATLGRRRA